MVDTESGLARENIEIIEKSEHFANFLQNIRKNYKLRRTFSELQEIKEKLNVMNEVKNKESFIIDFDIIVRKGLFYEGKTKFRHILKDLSISDEKAEILAMFVKAVKKNIDQDFEEKELVTLSSDYVMPVFSSKGDSSLFDERVNLNLEVAEGNAKETIGIWMKKDAFARILSKLNEAQDNLDEFT